MLGGQGCNVWLLHHKELPCVAQVQLFSAPHGPGAQHVDCSRMCGYITAARTYTALLWLAQFPQQELRWLGQR